MGRCGGGRFGEGQSGGNFQEGRSVQRNHMTFSLLYGGTAEPDAVRLIDAVVIINMIKIYQLIS